MCPADKLFQAADFKTREFIHTLNDKATPVFLQLQISPYAAKAALLLSRCINGDLRARPYLTFFGNSRMEALDGAIKVARHAACKKKSASKGTLLVLDADEAFLCRHDPLKASPEDMLVPGITNITFSDFIPYRPEEGPVAVVFRADMHRDVFEVIMEKCRKLGALAILDLSDCNVDTFLSSCVQGQKPDIVVTGENLTGRQVPFGAFSMASHVYRTWNTFDDCFIHTSTFGGNSLSLGIVVSCLLRLLHDEEDFDEITRIMEEIATDQRAAFRWYSRYVNPKGALLLAAMGVDRRYVSARGTELTIRVAKGEERIFDALGSYGSCMRGHNPPDIKEVLDRHEPGRDYWKDLEGELHGETGFPHALPAVSGATAVEAALIISLVAQSPRKKVVVFNKGFAGKTMSALIGTAKTHYREPFRPLYRHVEYVDPFVDEGVRRIEDLALAKEVALFWFEPVQGEGGVRAIPDRVFQLLCDLREDCGYLVAIDEIQTGMFRTGVLLNSAAHISADVVTLAKGLADMTFPIGATLVSEEVYQRARRRSPEVVDHLERYYLNQLGSHIALHGLQKATEAGLGDHVLAMGEILKKGLEELRPLSSMILDTRGTGLLQAIEFNSHPWGISLPMFGNYFGALFGGLCLRHANWPCLTAYTLNNPSIVRIEPPLTVSQKEIEHLLSNLRDTVKGGYGRLLLSSLAHILRRFTFPGSWVR